MSKSAQVGDVFTGTIVADDADEYPGIRDRDDVHEYPVVVGEWPVQRQVREMITETIGDNRALAGAIDIDGLVKGLPKFMDELGTEDPLEAAEKLCERLRRIVVVPSR